MKPFLFLILSCFLLWSFQSSIIKARQGEVFKVVLKANHSTGYSWQWDKKAGTSIIDSVHMSYVLSDRAITGACGNEIWEFKAKRKGDYKLILKYSRPWENKLPAEIKEIHVSVE